MDSSLPTVQVDFTLSVGGGRLDASLDVPERRITLTELLPALQILNNQIIGSTLRIVQSEGHEVSCREGCAACCRQFVPLSLFEAEALAGWIRTLPQDRQHALEARFHTAISALRDAGVLARMDPATWRDDSAHAKDLAIDYLAQRVACPFLEEESCSIHPMRPFSCREYLVTSPPEFCEDPSTHAVVGVPVPLKLSNLLYKLGALVDHSETGWIPLVFLLAWMRSEARPGDGIVAPGPELLRNVVQRLKA